MGRLRFDLKITLQTIIYVCTALDKNIRDARIILYVLEGMGQIMIVGAVCMRVAVAVAAAGVSRAAYFPPYHITHL